MRRPVLHPATATQLDLITPATAGSYIFHGAPHTGRYLAAQWLAIRLNCVAGGDTCATCRQITAGNFPDFITVAPEDKPSVTIEQVRKLLQTLTLSPYSSQGTRLAVIDAADSLTPEAQNALLKSLEEPPERTRFILITTSLNALLPTVRSRLGSIYFAPVESSQVAAELRDGYQVPGPKADKLAGVASGAVGYAINLARNDDAAQAHEELASITSRFLSGTTFDRLIVAKQVAESKRAMAPVLTQLHQAVVASLTGGVTAHTPRLAAIATARRLSASGVTARVVLDRLALELG